MPHSRNGTRTSVARKNSSFTQGVGRLSDDVGHLKDDLSNIARHSVGAARAGAAEARRTLQRKIKAAKQSGAIAGESVKEQMMAHPMTSLGVAAGVGLLVGLFLFRARK